MLVSRPLHPWQPSHPEEQLRLSVSLSRASGALTFAFEMDGDLSRIVFPNLKAQAERSRADELWKTTCMELFFSRPGTENYTEFNLSPSGDWNAYEFTSYRGGMKPAAETSVEISGVEAGANRFILRGIARSPVFSLSKLEASATSVIEFGNRQIQYWAVKHAGAKPDFHLRSSFSIDV